MSKEPSGIYSDKISIVIPVYKVEKYLDNCIGSVVSQSYRNLEIILVDDGSPDRCGSVCDEWAVKDPRIHVIHQSNGGLSAARNAGIDYAVGEYIAFVDSDDFILPNYIERLYTMCVDCQAEIAVCGIHRIRQGERLNYNRDFIREKREQDGIRRCSGVDILREMHTKENYQEAVVTWNKLYRRELFQDIRFPLNKIYEDGFTTHKLLYRAQRVAVTQERLYVYLLSPGSISRRPYNFKNRDDLEAFEERNKFFQKQGEKEIYRHSMSWYTYFLRNQYYDCKMSFPEHKEVYREIWKTFCATVIRTWRYREMPIRRKLSMTYTMFFPGLYYRRFIKQKELEWKQFEFVEE